MSYKEYRLAQSAAGNDKGRLYVVLEQRETSVLLIDGKQRKLSAPKKKNMKTCEVPAESRYRRCRMREEE